MTSSTRVSDPVFVQIQDVSGAQTTPYYKISIPTNQSFTTQWYKWIFKNTLRHFKRNKERADDAVQDVILRLLHKDAIGRWFFKHLRLELVDRAEAERILGLESGKLAFISNITPTHGSRKSANSLWKIEDLLNYAKFDYDRFYYSVQGHTIDSPKVLRLLGFGPTDVSHLESLYRQGRLRPSELTEHHCTEQNYMVEDAIPHLGECKHEACTGIHQTISLGFCNRHNQLRLCAEPECKNKHMSRGYCNVHYGRSRREKCISCDHGRELLMSRKLSLTDRWSSPESIDAALKLRWNDKQLAEFLRDWRRQNIVSTTPRYIMRPSAKLGVDAGLLAYMLMLINNCVVNDFKTLTRSEDLENAVLNKGMGPEFSNDQQVGWDGSRSDGGNDNPEMVTIDVTALSNFHKFEMSHDVRQLIETADLTPDEFEVIDQIDIQECDSIKEYAHAKGKSIQQIHKIRNSALSRMNSVNQPVGPSDSLIENVSKAVCEQHGVSMPELLGPSRIGAPVAARTDLFGWLHSMGMPISHIADRYQFGVEMVTAAVARAARKAPRVVPTAELNQ